MGHMNIQHYAARFDEATWQMFGMIGLTPEYLKAQGRGMAAAEQKTTYRCELLPGDLITICSEIIEMRARTIRFRHVMRKSVTDQIVAETEFVGVHIDTSKRKSCEFEGLIIQSARNLAQS
jgi:acyl-CoA thioester hydrolase